jgi:hypothetical protein
MSLVKSVGLQQINNYFGSAYVKIIFVFDGTFQMFHRNKHLSQIVDGTM